MNWACLGYLRQ